MFPVSRNILRNSNRILHYNPHNQQLIRSMTTSETSQLLSIKQCSELPKAKLPEYIKSSTSRLYNVIWRDHHQQMYILLKAMGTFSTFSND